MNIVETINSSAAMARGLGELVGFVLFGLIGGLWWSVLGRLKLSLWWRWVVLACSGLGLLWYFGPVF